MGAEQSIERWAYVAAAARELKLDRRTIMRWIERGRITPRVEGGTKQRRYLVRLRDLEAFRPRTPQSVQ